jgi:hypothetical protein
MPINDNAFKGDPIQFMKVKGKKRQSRGRRSSQTASSAASSESENTDFDQNTSSEDNSPR